MGRAAPLLLASLVLLAACGGREPEPSRIGAYPADLFYVERDLFLPADEPEVVAAEEADHLREDDDVFGVVVGGRARAYPVTMLAYHHVVNDVIEGVPVAVTY